LAWCGYSGWPQSGSSVGISCRADSNGGTQRSQTDSKALEVRWEEHGEDDKEDDQSHDERDEKPSERESYAL